MEIRFMARVNWENTDAFCAWTQAKAVPRNATGSGILNLAVGRFGDRVTNSFQFIALGRLGKSLDLGLEALNGFALVNDHAVEFIESLFQMGDDGFRFQ